MAVVLLFVNIDCWVLFASAGACSASAGSVVNIVFRMFGNMRCGMLDIDRNALLTCADARVRCPVVDVFVWFWSGLALVDVLAPKKTSHTGQKQLKVLRCGMFKHPPADKK